MAPVLRPRPPGKVAKPWKRRQRKPKPPPPPPPPPPEESGAVFIFFTWESLGFMFDFPEIFGVVQRAKEMFLSLAVHYQKQETKCKLMANYRSVPKELMPILEGYFKEMKIRSQYHAAKLEKSQKRYEIELDEYLKAPVVELDEDDISRFYPVPPEHERHFYHTQMLVFHQTQRLYEDKEIFLKKTLQDFGALERGNLVHFCGIKSIHSHTCLTCDEPPVDSPQGFFSIVQNAFLQLSNYCKLFFKKYI